MKRRHAVFVWVLGLWLGGFAPSARAESEALGAAVEQADVPIGGGAQGALSTAGQPARAELRVGKRLFVRAGLAYGLAYVGRHQAADRSLTAALLSQAPRDVDEARAWLARQGYDCDVQSTPDGGLQTNGCDVAVQAPGFEGSPGFDLAGGLMLSPRVGLALTARVSPRGGRGVLSHAVLGVEAELELTEPRARGFALMGALGLGAGQIQVRPVPHVGPYVASGLFEAHVGLRPVYRATSYLAVYAAPVLRLLAPDVLWVLDGTLGVEILL